MNLTRIFFIAMAAFFLPFLLDGTSTATDSLPNDLPISDNFTPGYGPIAGRILMVEGKAVVVHGDQRQGYWIKTDMPLYQDDILATRKNSRLRFTLNDGSILTMLSESHIVLSQLEIDQRNRSSFLKMDQGKTRFYVKKLLKLQKSEFKVKTPTALVGVRGSDFIIFASAKSTQVTTLDDTVLEVVSLAALDQPPTILHSFQRTTVNRGQLPSEVEDVDPFEIERLKKEFGGGPEASVVDSTLLDIGRQGKVEEDHGPSDGSDVDNIGATESKTRTIAENQVLVPEEKLVKPDSWDELWIRTLLDMENWSVDIAAHPEAGKGAVIGNRSIPFQGSSVVLDSGVLPGTGMLDIFAPAIEEKMVPDITELPPFPDAP